MSNNIADQMRSCADLLEKFGRLYGYPKPEQSSWTAESLRAEAAYLSAPITEDAK